MNKQNGFTLVEMAVVLAIVGLLLGGTLIPLSARIENRRVEETRQALDEIREALVGFAVVNGRLPCPAPAATATGTVGAGLEPAPVLAGGCANTAGVLPWATLGVGETDAWGNRYTYRVAPEFARTVPQTAFSGPTCPPPANPQLAAFALCSQGNMTILNTKSGNALSRLVPAVIVSHGRNGNSAYTPQGTQRASGADADELENRLTAGGTATANSNFVSKTPTATFDDLIAWISPNILFNRMVSAQKLP
ncbi:MAG: type II secretion system protein [Sulfuricella sp.]|nr:type II secretion system protein [Sulfuricella sp.]